MTAESRQFVMVAGLSRAEEPTAPGQSDEIVFGMSTVLSGPAADLGLNMRAGVLAAIDEAKRLSSRGVRGRRRGR
jgi:ABC-type branched-subunit amino acid transport system substrate-binding protein